MTDNTAKAKAYLHHLQDEERDVQQTISRARNYKIKAMDTAAYISDMPRPASPDLQHKARLVDAAVDLEKAAEEKHQLWLQHRDEAMRYIQMLSDSTERNVLKCRYLDALHWNDIATTLGYSEPTIFRFHRCALENLGSLL